MNAHVQVKVAKAEIGRVLSILALTPGFECDDQLKLSMLEGETELTEIVSAMLADNEDDEGTIAALDAQIEARTIRKDRMKQRIAGRKKAISSLMDCAQITKLALPEATLSLRTLMPRPKVADADQLPSAFVTEETVRKPNHEAIAAAVEQGTAIPGVVLTNGGSSLTVRRK